MTLTFEDIIERVKASGDKKRLAVLSPKKRDLEVLCRAAEEGLILPLLIGDGKAVQTLVKKSSLVSLEHEIVDSKDSIKGLRRAITMARDGQVDILMQGSMAQKTFMTSIIDAKTGLLKSKRASYVSVLQVQKQDRLIFVTDSFVHNVPGIVDKQFILENAFGLAGRLGMDEPKVAVLAAIEQVNPSIASTLDAAILSKMSQRRQFGKAVVEGPLDMDCALSRVAASRKGLQSIVTGNADIYLVPGIETGYPLVEALVFFGGMKAAGILLGTAKPVILNLPFNAEENRVVEIAIAALMSP